jgi:hypothetical protein
MCAGLTAGSRSTTKSFKLAKSAEGFGMACLKSYDESDIRARLH